MKTYNTISLLLLLCLSGLLGCKEEEEDQFPVGTELLKNRSAESGAADWLRRDGDYSVEWTSEASLDLSSSLKISSDTLVDNFSFWAQEILQIPKGKRLRLSVNLKTVDVEGSHGVFISMRADSNTEPLHWYTTQDEIFIGETQNWTAYSLEMDEKIKDEVEKIYIFLTLGPFTTGTVYFDNISLKVVE